MPKSLVMAVALCAAWMGAAETLGFWDFRDGNAGEDVSTVANSAGTGSFTSDTAKKSNGDAGVLPKFNDDSPGKLRDGLNGSTYCTNPQSIDFRYDTREDHRGGYIDLTGVADAISGKGDFTIEYFVKQNADYSYYETGDGDYVQRSKTMLYLEGRTGYGGLKQIMPSTVVKTGDSPRPCRGVTLEVYAHGSIEGKQVSTDVDLCDGKWHHVAIVYAETNATDKAGTVTFYWDHGKVNELAYLNDPEDTTGLKLRLGTGYKNQVASDKTTTEPVNASISALRVSDVALSKSEFLYEANPDYDIAEDGTIALLTFSGKTTGESATSVSYDASDLQILKDNNGTGYKVNGHNDTGLYPAYCDDVPGRYLFSSAACTNILAQGYKSLKFTTEGEGTSQAAESFGVGGGYLNFPLLGTAISYQQSYTIEMFIKDEDWSEWQWESGVFSFTTVTNGVNIQNRCLASSVKSTKTSWYVRMTDSSKEMSKVSKASSLKDGKWHHLAIVFDGTTKKQTIYLDYEPGTPVDYENGFATGQRFVLGTFDNNEKYCWHGKIAGIRVVPRALAVADFMVAHDYKYPDGYVFAVNFNDGEGKNGQTFVSGNTATSNKALTPAGAETMTVKYGLHSMTYPQFAEGSAVRAGRMIQWGTETVWENLAGCHFLGYGSLTNGTPNRQYAGTELCVAGSEDAYRNPTNWTMEAFVKPEYDNLNSAHLFGKGAVANQHAQPTPYPRYCWMLTRNTDGRLVLYWAEKADDPEFKYTSETTDYYKSVTTTNPVLKDKRWYHVALSYNKPTKTFKLYVNYQLVLTQATSGRELLDSTHDYYFSRMSASNGFEGWMDEIRFSDSALEPTQFEKLNAVGYMIIVR